MYRYCPLYLDNGFKLMYPVKLMFYFCLLIYKFDQIQKHLKTFEEILKKENWLQFSGFVVECLACNRKVIGLFPSPVTPGTVKGEAIGFLLGTQLQVFDSAGLDQCFSTTVPWHTSVLCSNVSDFKRNVKPVFHPEFLPEYQLCVHQTGPGFTLCEYE